MVVVVIAEESKKKISINLDKFKNNPKLTLFMNKLKKSKIDIDSLNDFEINKLFECILIVSR